MTETAADTLPRFLAFAPWWLQGQVAQDVFGAAADQVADWDTLDLSDQLFVLTATWGLQFFVTRSTDGAAIATGWEPDYGIPTITTDSLDVRRKRVLARRRGAVRTDADFITFVHDLLLPAPTGNPDARDYHGQYVVYVPRDSGFPLNFADVEAALRQAGPAHLGLWLAGWDSTNGVTLGEMDLMTLAAVDELTLEQLSGPGG